MKILFVTSAAFPVKEGIANHIFSISKELAARNHTITILTRNNRFRVDSTTLEDIPIVKYPFLYLRPFHIKLSRRYLNRLVNEQFHDYDILHYHSPLVPNIEHSNGFSTFITFHSPMLTDTAAIENFGWKTRLIKWNARYFSYPLEKRFLKAVDQVIAVSQNVRDELITYYPRPQNEIKIIPNAVDTELFTFRPQPAFQENDHLIYVGRLSYRKGLMTLIEAMNLLLKKHRRQIKLKIYGDGELKERIVARINNLQLQHSIELCGFIPNEQMPAYYQQALMFINPAAYESGPITLLEAMAIGLPVLSTLSGIIETIGKPLVNYIPIHPNAEQMAATINEAMADHQRLEQIGANARKTVEHRYTWKAIVDQLEGLYGDSK